MTTTAKQAPTALLATQLETLINTTSGMHVVKYESVENEVHLRVAADLVVAVNPQTGEETTSATELELHLAAFMGEINVYRCTAADELDWLVTWPTVTPGVALLLLEALITNPLLALTEPAPVPQAAAVETGYLVVCLDGGVVTEYGYVPALYYAGLAVMAHTDTDKDAVVYHADGVISVSDESGDRDAWAFPVQARPDPEADSGILVSEVGGVA